MRRWFDLIAIRAAMLAGLLAALWLLVESGHATLLAWTDRLFPVDRYPALFGALFATWLVAACASAPRLRRAALFLGSIGTAMIVDVRFALGSVAWFAVFHAILFSASRHRVRWALAFVLVSTAALALACNRDLRDPGLELRRWGYLAAVSYTFRIAWLLHQVRVQRTEHLPLASVLTYFLFAPGFVVVPYMLAIPRCDTLCAGLDRHDVALERSGLRMIAVGAAMTLALSLVSRLYDPMTASLAAVRDHDHAAALVHGLLYYPPQVIVKAIAISSILVGMFRVLGIDLGPSFVRPELSRSITEWWRRWNVHFRDLLVDLFYYPVIMRYRRKPVKATVLGCASVFLVGSFLFHWPKTYFSAGSFRAWPMGTLTEDIVMFVVVAVALLREQRQPRPPAWYGRLTTWLLVFVSVVLVGYSTTAWWNTHVSPHSPLPRLRSSDVSTTT